MQVMLVTIKKSMDKKTLRTMALHQREQLSTEIQNEIAEIMIYKLKTNPTFISAKHVGIYYPIHQEINLLMLIDLYPDKQFYLPNIEFGRIKYRLIERLDSLIDAPFGLKEVPKYQPSIEDCDLYIIPCVATSKLLRIGYGKGYFDQFLIGKKGYKLGITYPAFKYDYELSEPHDILLDDVL